MATSTMRKINLLVLDDDPSMVRLVSKVLQDKLPEALAVSQATDPSAARQWLEENCCDILISDIEMPEIDGLAMLQFAKSRNAWTQVIFLTGHSTLDRIGEAMENGASDYLLKPVDHAELVDVVAQHCRRAARWRAALHGTFRPAEAGV